MDNHNADQGNISLLISIITGMLAWIGSYSLGEVFKGVSMAVSIIAGIMAIRYYYYATKKQK